MEINWTVVMYFVIALFALSGFFKGWWKEAVTTLFLAILVFLLINPDIARTVIEGTNGIMAIAWDWLNTGTPTPQLDPADATTWLVILITFIIIATLISRSMLPSCVRKAGFAYTVRPMGSILGGLMGALNGFLIINLIREYIDGRSLPAGANRLEVALAGSANTGGIASSGVSITATHVPTFTILDSFMPWIIIGLGVFVLLAILRSRVGLHSKNGFRRIDYRVPYGHQRIDFK